MKEYKLNIPRFITIIALISVLIAIIILTLTVSLDYKDAISLILNFSFVSAPLAIIWYYFENYGWKSQWLRFTKLLFNIPPNINGRWEGELTRTSDNCPHNFVIEIKQTMSQLQVYTYSQNGKSESIVDNITSDKMKDNFQLTYLWEGNAGKLANTEHISGKFKGFTILRLIENGDQRKLTGEYFTDRQPFQTKGKINVHWTSYELKNEFQ